MQIMTLNEMLTQLRMEARISTNVAHGAHQTDSYIALLRRNQQELYDGYDWPMLKTVQTADLASGVRYLAYPAILSFEGITGVYAQNQSGKWEPLTYGINMLNLNECDSDLDERRPNVQRWQHYVSPEAETLNQNMCEVWPIPDRNTKLRFEGKRALFPLTNPDTDRSTIDGPLIVLHAAVELLAAQKAEDASVKLQKAQLRMDQLKRRQTGPDNRRINMAATGGVRPDQRFRIG